MRTTTSCHAKSLKTVTHMPAPKMLLKQTCLMGPDTIVASTILVHTTKDIMRLLYDLYA